MAFKLDIRGLDKKIKDFNNLPKKMKQEIEGKIESAVQEINLQQVSNAPIDMGRLRQATFYERLGEMSYGLFSLVEYAPYQEFGTGGFVNVPQGLEGYASQFKGKGIKEINIPPQPYFFPPFFAKKTELENEIKTILKNL